MVRMLITKKALGITALLLALILLLNIITPVMPEVLKEAVSPDSDDYTLTDVVKDDDSAITTLSEKSQFAYDDGRILIYNYSQLSMIGSGESVTYDDGVTAVYSADAEYKLARDIPLPRHTLWQLPENFTGTITGEEQEDAPLYDNDKEAVYLYHPYQLAVLAMDNANSQPVMSGDAYEKTFGSGKVICTDEEENNYLTYGDNHNYVVSASFTSEISEKPVSVVSENKNNSKASAKVSKTVVGTAPDGRDFAGQVVKEIDGEKYILIGNEDQLRAIGTDKDVYSAIYEITAGTANGGTEPIGNKKMLYCGDADLLNTQNGNKTYSFQSIDTSLLTYARVDQETGEVYKDLTHTSTIKTNSQLTTGEKYTATANYIIFRDINLGGSARPWTPLMFSGNMYGAKSSNGESLWDSSGITATALVNRPVISNVYVNQNTPIKSDDYIGIGFFATVTNEINVADVGVSAGTVKVHNIELNQVEVHNTATTAQEASSLVSTITSSLGWIVGGLLDGLTTVLSFGSVRLTLRDTLSALLDARATDPTIYSTGAFAGRVVGDVEIKDCAVTGSVTVENLNDNTGGFAGYTEGVTQYSGLSQVLGGLTDALSSLLNVIPGLGLGDLIDILLNNALPLGDLVPTGYYEPHIINSTVDHLSGYIGQSSTNNNGGFVGLQIGTQIEDCTVQNSSYTVRAAQLGGGFSGVARDAEIKGTLNDLGVDVIDENQIFSRINSNLNNVGDFETQSLLRDCSIEGSGVGVQGGDYLGGFAGALAASYAIDCEITGDEYCTLDVTGNGDHIGGFVGETTLGWFSSIGKDDANQNDNSLLATVRQLGTGLLSSGNEGQNQKLLALVGLVPSAVMGCQIDAGPVNVSGRQYVGGLLGRGQGVYLTESSADYMNQLTFWQQDNITQKTSRINVLNNLAAVTASGDFAGGAAGELETVNIAGVLDGTLSAGSFNSFTVSEVSVTGVEGGYVVKATGAAQDFNGEYAGGGFGRAYGGTISDVTLAELKRVEAENNKAAGFIASAGPGDVLASGGLTINLLGLNYLLNVENLLSLGESIHVTISDSSVTGIDDGFTVEAKGSGNSNEGYQYLASGFIAQSNSTEIVNCHTDNLLSVKAAALQGCSGGFVGVSTTGGLSDVSDVDGIESLLSVEGGLLNAVEYLIPSYTNCTVTYVDGGYVDADIAGGFVADLESGTVDNSTIASVDDAQNPKWTHTMKELYDPDAVNATGDLDKQFSVFNIDYVHGRTYGGGFGGKLRSGALADSDGGISILGNTELSIDVDDLTEIMNAYVPYVEHAGVYSENGFTVYANTLRSNDPASGSAGGFAGFMSGAQVSHSDVYKLKNTGVTPPSDLEAVNAPSYFDSSQSTYAVTGGHFAGGYVGNMDIGSAASLGDGLKILGSSIDLTDAISALSVVISTVEHSDVQGAGGGFSAIADGTDSYGKVGIAGGFAGGICGGHIQNSHCKNFYYIIGQEAAGGYAGNMEPGNVANLLDDGSVFTSLINVNSALASLVEDFVPTIRNSTTSCVPCGGAVRAQAASDSGHQRGVAGGYCGHNEGGHIRGLNTDAWKAQNDQSDNYNGERHIAAAWRIRSVYGFEYAGGFTGFMESADTANTGNISLLGGLISAGNILTALKAVYPTEEHTAVYGPLRNLDVDTWNAWVTYVGKYGGYGAELASDGTVSTQAALDAKLSKYIYGCNVVAGRSSHDTTAITEGGNAGGYAGYMVSGVITDGQSYDMKRIRAMRSAGGYAGKMQSGAAASFGSVSILGLNLNVGNLVKAAQVFVPTIKSGTVHGWQSGMTVESFGTDYTHKCGYAGGYAGSAYGAQIWGDKNAGNTAGTGCNVSNLRYVKGTNAVGGYVGTATAASVADVNTNASDGLLQGILDNLVSNPSDLASVIQATVTTIRKAEINPDNSDFGFTVGGVGGTAPRFAGGFAGSLEASVIGSRAGESDITVNGLRSVDGLYYAGGFVGLADIGGVASVSSGSGSTTILDLINAGNVDLLSVFQTYIYYSDVNGVSDGMVIRAYESAPSGILSETRQSGCAGGFGGGVMNGTVVHCDVTNLNTAYAPNYSGGFIGHMGKNGAVHLNNAAISSLLGLNAGVLDVFGTSVNECNATGIDAGAVIVSVEGAEPISGGFAGYADDAQIKNSNMTKLKQVRSDEIAGGFVGKTNMSYAVSAEVDAPLVQLVLGIVNALVKALYVDELEASNLFDLDIDLVSLKLLSDGDLLYVNLLGLRIGVSLVKSADPGVTDTALITIGDSTVELPCNENGIDTTGQNAEVVVNLIKSNRTRIDNCSVTGVSGGYDVYGGGASNTEDGSGANGCAGGFVGYNNEGKFTSDRMVYCDVIRGTAHKVGTFSGETSLESVYSFNTLESIEKVAGEENHYSVYRDTDLTYALTSSGDEIATATADDGTAYSRFDITHLEAPITPDTNEAYYHIFEKWEGAKLASDASGEDAAMLGVYVSSAKAVLMLDTPTDSNDESLIPDPGENNDPCGNIELTVQKVWNDNNNKDHSRPNQIQVRIRQYLDDNANGELYLDSSVISDVDTVDGWFTISRSEHGRAGSATWTRTIKNLPVYTTVNGTTHYYSYTVEEAPVLGYSSTVTYDETGSTTTAKIVNTPEPFEIQFKYYDRYEINGKPSGIEDEETVYSVSVNSIPKDYITYNDTTNAPESIDFAGLIGDKAVEFSDSALSVKNVMCDYDLWTSQSAAAAAMSRRSFFVDGDAVDYSDATYHTDYLGKPKYHEAYSGREESKNEKWVNYYDSDGKELEESFETANDYLKVKKIVVWCYNYPRQYNVDIYGADSADDLVRKTVGESTVYVANATGADNNVKHLNDHFYYNQRFGNETGDEDEDDGGFIVNYGLDRYTGVLPSDYAEESIDEYDFAYWAYDQNGTQIASVDRDFWYRVTDNTKLYAVYALPGSTDPGISISANVNDTYVDESGVSRTRLNILGSVYGAEEYDTDVKKLSLVNIALSTQIRDNPDVYTPVKINALFEQYKDQLKDIVETYDEKSGSKSFNTAHTYDGALDENGDLDTTLNLTLTTKGYIFTVTSNGNTPAAGDLTAKLTNKNRVQFTTVFKTSALNVNNTGSSGDTCLMYCAALKYQDDWSISTNCLIYHNGEAVSNTAADWN